MCAHPLSAATHIKFSDICFKVNNQMLHHWIGLGEKCECEWAAEEKSGLPKTITTATDKTDVVPP